MRLLVTGAGGFLGRAVVARAAEEGHHVIAASRSGKAVAGAADCQASGDLSQGIGALDLSGVEAVIHCAARVHVLKRETSAKAEASYRAMNAQLPVTLAKAAREAGVARFVQVSSVAALASRTKPGVTIDDGSAPRPTSAYGKAKLAADQALGDLAGDAFSVISLRPPAIYGPGVGAWFALLARAAKAGIPLPLAGFANRRSVAFVGNIADAIVVSAGSNRNGSFILTDSLPISTAALYRKLITIAGHSGRVWRWPRPLVQIPARLALGDRADSLLGDAAFDGSRFASELDWQPRVSMDEALRKSFA